MSWTRRKVEYDSRHTKTCFCSLISVFVVHCLDSLIPLVSISEISSLYLVSVTAQAGLSLSWSQTPKTGFLDEAHMMSHLRLLMIASCIIKWAAARQNQHNDMCALRRFISAWVDAQSDQSLRWALNGYQQYMNTYAGKYEWNLTPKKKKKKKHLATIFIYISICQVFQKFYHVLCSFFVAIIQSQRKLKRK